MNIRHYIISIFPFRVVAVITGGNIDSTTLGRALDRGMAAEGRLVKYKVAVQDKQGGLGELCNKLAGIGVIVRDCVPERACVGHNVYTIEARTFASNYFIFILHLLGNLLSSSFYPTAKEGLF